MTETRQRLLAATRECLGREGLASTTSRDIAAAAGANLAAITYHFGSKNDLVAAALLEGIREWLTPTIDVLSGDGEPAERTVTAIRMLLATFERHRDDAPVYLEALLQAPRMQPLERGLARLWADLRHLLADQMRRMKDDRLLPGWVEPEAMASLFIAVANGLVLQASVDRGGPPMADVAGQFGALLLAVAPATAGPVTPAG